MNTMDKRVHDLIQNGVASNTNVTSLLKFITAEGLNKSLSEMKIEAFPADEFKSRYKYLDGNLKGFENGGNAIAYLSFLQESKQDIVIGSNAHTAVINIASLVSDHAAMRYEKLEEQSKNSDEEAAQWQELIEIIESVSN